MKSQLGAALLLGLVLVGVHADGDGDELLDEARCLGGRITYLGRNSLRNARITCILSIAAATTTANPNGGIVLSAELQREILELYHELSTINNAAAGENEILPRFASGAESARPPFAIRLPARFELRARLLEDSRPRPGPLRV
ncbi:unnamed protein product [Darwinula stevensoni]|uniref:Secreted protein n=1 Tax=Darwinula stevensoni TaxID=69355 RepID=A0A7R9AAW4_9CRUS|nr:unnamed protein product [Darwinula stevensoni]CAG0898806.1 unnamed protein product [Darwinula stevensoni]